MAISSNVSNLISLMENDIPGTSLLGRKPEELKNSELKFWLKCHGDAGKGLKAKAELVRRANEYIQTGKDKQVVDPDPHKTYSHRKEKQGTSSGPDTKSNELVQFRSSGWGTSLQKMPMFMWLEMNCHVVKSGKAITNVEYHTVLTGLVKARRFCDDEYLKDLNV